MDLALKKQFKLFARDFNLILDDISASYECLNSYEQIQRLADQTFDLDKHNKEGMSRVRAEIDRRIKRGEPLLPLKLCMRFRAKLSRDKEWFQQAKNTALLHKRTQEYWLKIDSPLELEEALGWLLYSACINSALCSKASLDALLEHTLTQGNIHNFHGRPLLILRLRNAKSGDERIYETVPDEELSDQSDEEIATDPKVIGLCRSQHFIPDDITSLWLIHCRTYASEIDLNDLSADQLLRQVIKKLPQGSIGLYKSLKKWTSTAHYVFEQFEGVHIEQAYINVVTGQQSNCALKESAFSFAHQKEFGLSEHGFNYLSALFYDIGGFKESEDDELPDDEEERKLEITNDAERIFKTLWAKKQLGKIQAHDLLTRIDISFEQKEIQFQPAAKYLMIYFKHKANRGVVAGSLSNEFASYGRLFVRMFSGNYGKFESFTGDEFQRLYEKILIKKDSDNEKARCYKKLKAFHSFLCRDFNFPALPSDPSGLISYNYVRASYVNNELMNSLFNTLDNSETPARIKDQIKVAFTLAWRCGLRVEELATIQVKDIEMGEEMSLTLHRHMLIRGKTVSFQRRIPLWALLNQSEIGLLMQHRNYKFELYRDDPRAYLFSRVAENRAWSPTTFSRMLSTALNSIKPKPEVSFHSLRHTALTRLGWVFDPLLATKMTDYSEQEIKNIRVALVGHTDISDIQDKFFAIAQVAGHLTPESTFSTYMHGVGMSVGWQMSNVQHEFPVKLATLLTGHSHQKIARRCKETRGFKNGLVTLSQINDWLHSALITKNSVSVDRELIPIQQKLNYNGVELDDRPQYRAKHFSIDDVYIVLLRAEAGISCDAIANNLALPLSWVKRWVSNATYLANLTTRNDKPRYWKNSKNTNPISPVTPKNDLESAIAEKFLFKAESINSREELAPDGRSYSDWLEDFIRVTHDKFNTEKAEFTFGNIDEFKLFWQFIKIIFPIKNWEIKLHAVTLKEVGLNSAKDNVKVDSDKKINKRKRVEVRFISGIQKEDRSKKFSAPRSFRYGVFMLAVLSKNLQSRSKLG